MQVWVLCAAALAAYLVAVFQLDPIVRWLWPIPVAFFASYPYLKRFTWLCHLWLGACLGLAPPGAWLAVTGSAVGSVGVGKTMVAVWVAPTSSTRYSISSTIGSKGSTRGRRGSGEVEVFPGRSRPA